MSIDWEATSWRSLESWRVEASEWGCPIANEHQGELPSSRRTLEEIYHMFCEKNCGMEASPSPPWEPCPFEQLIKETLGNEGEE
jgi:hypothetical protein